MTQRTLGEKIAVSVGTAIPLEESIVTGKKLPVKELWVNIKTLFRNYYEAFEEQPTIKTPGVLAEFIKEAFVIRSLLDEILDVVYYDTNVSLLPKIFPEAKIKTVQSDGQKAYANLESLAISAAMRNKELGLRPFKQRIFGGGARAWMLTHHPVNLLSRYEFADLSLISSHTGSVKRPVEWIERLTKNEDYKKLPFNVLTLQVVGDSATQFYSQPQSIKRELLDIAEKGKWKPTTSIEKVKSDVDKCKNAEVADLFRRMLRVNLI